MATPKQTAATNYKLTLTGGAFSMKNRPVPEAIAVQIVRIVMGDSSGANPVPPGAGFLRRGQASPEDRCGLHRSHEPVGSQADRMHHR